MPKDMKGKPGPEHTLIRELAALLEETGLSEIELEREGVRMESVTFCKNAYEVAAGADALIVVTQWNEFKGLDMQRIQAAMRHAIVIDGRNMYEAAEMARLGFIYRGMGRGTAPASSILSADSPDGTLVKHEAPGIGEHA